MRKQEIEEIIGKVVIICCIWGIINCFSLGLLAGIVGVVLTGLVINS